MALSSEVVHRRLRAAALKCRWSRGARFVISGTAVSLFFLIVMVLGDAQFHFGAIGRWAGFFLTVSSFLAGIALALPAWFSPMSEASVARRIETVCAGSRNVLIQAVQFDREFAAGSPMRAALFSEMHDPFSEVRWTEVFDLDLLKKLAAALGVVALSLTLWAVVKPAYFSNSMARIFLPAGKIAPLTRTRISGLTPGDAQVVHGGELTVTATIAGEAPRAAWICFREAGSDWERTLMDREVGAAEFDFHRKEVLAPLDYYVEAGDARSETHRISVRPRTAVRTLLSEIEPPAYTKAAKSFLKDVARIPDVLPGSHLALTLEFNNPLAELRAEGNQQPLPVEKIDDARWRIRSKVMGDETIKVAYRDADGTPDTESVQVMVKADPPPKIVVSEPAEGKELFATREASLGITFTSTAGFGLGSVALYRSTDEKADAQLVQEWKEAAGLKSFTTEARVPLGKFTALDDERVTFCVIARDRNDVTGPGVAISRPIVVSLRTGEKLKEEAEKKSAGLQSALEELLKMQQTNLDQTRANSGTADANAFLPLLVRQTKIGDLGKELAASAESISPGLYPALHEVSEGEMPAAIVALRDASATGDASAPGGGERSQSVSEAIRLEAAILARLRGGSSTIETDNRKAQVEEIVAGIEDLARKEKAILLETGKANDQSAKDLSDRQDALADASLKVKGDLEMNAQNASLGDDDFRNRLKKVVAMFGEFRIYEEMLAAADKLQSKGFPAAANLEKGVAGNLEKMIDLLNQWQLAQAGEKVNELKKELEGLEQKLGKLSEIQREVLEKSKEMAHKDQFRPEDEATAKEMKETKDLMAKVVEKMLTDAHIFPDLNPANQLQTELTSIYEDVLQTDKEQAAEGKLKPNEIAVQKEQGIVDAINKAKKIAADMEMWLPNANDTSKWLLENFDKSELPTIANLPLPDQYEDLVGKLLDEQKGLDEQTQDAASNQALPMNPANGWQVSDGPQPGYSAQGKSGNTRPKKNEQTGRSSGGREGESDGEMAGDTADNLEGTTPDTRRTNDPMQQGQVADNNGPSDARATGGGKASGFSQREGMDGNGPLRTSNAPRMGARDALAVQQALLAQKTSKTAAEASLLYLRGGGLSDAARLMEQSETALQEGRMQDFAGLHRRIMARLNEAKGEVTSGQVVSLPSGDSARTAEKQLLGGEEGEAPADYKEKVADYYRSLMEEK